MNIRHKIHEIIPGKLYQRGQIMTWQPDVKQKIFEELGISIVVNFWPKIDYDLAIMPLDFYLYAPAMRSEQMLEDRMEILAMSIAQMLQETNAAALILCEAGVTRSVFFSVLVVSYYMNCSLSEAYNIVEAILPKMKLKQFMLDYIHG